VSDDICGPVISAVASFIAVLVGTALVPSVREYFSRKKSARYLAIRVVCILDKYIDDCASVSQDYGEPDYESGRDTPRVVAPPTPTYPTDVDWHSIDHRLMYDLLSLPNAADKASGMVDSCFEHAEDSGFETRSFEYATLGLKTFELTQRLRKTYGIPNQDLSEQDPVLRWDAVSVMNKELQEIKERRGKRAAEWDAMLPNLPPVPALPVAPTQ
jgi:hypothetical protein